MNSEAARLDGRSAECEKMFNAVVSWDSARMPDRRSPPLAAHHIPLMGQDLKW